MNRRAQRTRRRWSVLFRSLLVLLLVHLFSRSAAETRACSDKCHADDRLLVSSWFRFDLMVAIGTRHQSQNQSVHAEPSNISWVMVRQLLGPGDRRRSGIKTNRARAQSRSDGARARNRNCAGVTDGSGSSFSVDCDRSFSHDRIDYEHRCAEHEHESVIAMV